MQCVLIHIICISLLAVDILASSSSSISSWHQHQSYTRDISTSSGISSGLYRGSSFVISPRRRSAFIQPSSCCFATHNQSITSRRTTSIITATLFPIWKQRRSNTIESILNRVGRVEVNSAIPYIDTLSTAGADLDMTADNLLQSASSAVDGLSKLNEVKDDTTTDDTSNIDNTPINTNESVPPDDKQKDEDDEIEEAKEEKSILIHTYTSNLLATNDTTNPATAATSTSNANNNDNQNLSLMGVGMSQRQFAAWVQYYITHMSEDGEVIPADQSSSQSATAAAAQGILSRQPQLQQTIDEHAQQIILQQQHIQRTANSQTLDNLLQSNQITTESVEYESKTWEEEYIPMIRQYWKNGKLICEHTNILNGRRRPPVADEKSSEEDGKSGEKLTKEEKQAKKDEETRQYKTEQFRDTLNSYSERLTSIVEDELSDVHFHPPSEVVGSSDQEKRLPFNFGQIVDLPKRTLTHQTTPPQHHQHHHQIPQWQTTNGLKGWIEDHYGIDNTRQLTAEVLLSKSEKEQLQTFQTFLDWFRNNFPYFHDQCDSCEAPCKDDPEPHKSDDDMAEKDIRAEGSNNIEEQQTNGVVVDQQEDEDEDDFSFLGYVYPTPSEKLGNASRTELYQCRTCSTYTRFPRYNKAIWVTTTQRGRCGEYSMLLYRMLRVLGYENVRWVVDWADHVWAEVWLGGSSDNAEGSNSSGGRWVHLDPCEAAVDNPLLYESWGKNQTYIVAFHDPFYKTTSSSKLIEGDRIPVATASLIPEQSDTIYRFPPVEDVTSHYTSDESHVIEERRGILDESVAKAINEVSKNIWSIC